MLRLFTVLAAVLAVCTPSFGITADDVLSSLDHNRTFGTERFHATMTVSKGQKVSVKDFTGYGQSEGNKFFMEFRNPEDKGVKYLRLDNDLWIYMPDADDTLKISGHMLRQGMMGSDLSYEDLLSGSSWRKQYAPRITGTTNIGGADCTMLELTAIDDSASYYRRVCAVDTSRNVAPLLEFYAKSGRLLKRMTQEDFRQIGSRTVAFRFSVSDLTRGDSRTVIEFTELRMDESIPADMFSKQNLRK
jgi:outer membrane lipoprotein-sorting protein